MLTCVSMMEPDHVRQEEGSYRDTAATDTYQKLEEFEDDLHKHVHLENNILFPKASRR